MSEINVHHYYFNNPADMKNGKQHVTVDLNHCIDPHSDLTISIIYNKKKYSDVGIAMALDNLNNHPFNKFFVFIKVKLKKVLLMLFRCALLILNFYCRIKRR